MKRLLLIGIIASVLLSPIAAAVPMPARDAPSLFSHVRTPTAAVVNVSIYEDALDQAQTTNTSGYLPVGNSYMMYGGANISVAQSFVPTKPILTRAQFYMAKNASATYPCSFAVRDNLTGENLAYATMNPQAFPDYPSAGWVEFDFFDIPVTVNTTYYFVVWTQNVTDNYYYVYGGGDDPYPNGDAYYSINNGNWTIISEGSDAAFQTYGREIPSWATGMYSGVWGLNVAGMPLIPLGWFTGFSRQRILLGFDGIFAPFNVTVHNATMALTGVIIGPFLLGAVHNLTTGKAAWTVGLGGINATTSVFLIRLMLFLGPTFFLAGKYYAL